MWLLHHIYLRSWSLDHYWCWLLHHYLLNWWVHYDVPSAIGLVVDTSCSVVSSTVDNYDLSLGREVRHESTKSKSSTLESKVSPKIGTVPITVVPRTSIESAAVPRTTTWRVGHRARCCREQHDCR